MHVYIAFSSDNNYAPFLGVAIYSLLSNSNKRDFFEIKILDGGISLENITKINKSINEFTNKKVEFIKINDKYFKNIQQFIHLNKSAFYRILLPELLKTKKILYLDCDLIVLDDISKLYKTKLNTNLIGACKIFHPNYQAVLQKSNPKIKIKQAVNTGVLIMNLKKMRTDKCSNTWIKFANRNSQRLLAADQDIFNIYSIDKIKLINPRWNATSYLFLSKNYKKCGVSQKTYLTCINQPGIVHFDGIKPWAIGSIHPYKKTFLKYLSKTEFRNYKTKINLKELIKNYVFFFGNKIAKLLPNLIYDIIEKQYLKNNFLEKRYQNTLSIK